MNKLKKSFTLVELIIVIAIIAILAVTAFLMLTKWIAKSRDSSRLSDMNTMDNALQIYLTEKSVLPKPENAILIYASGTSNVVGYQGDFGDNIAKSLGNLNSAPKDRLDNLYYTYYVDSTAKKYELLGYTEQTSSVLNTANAVDYSARFIKVSGDKLGILTDTNKISVHRLGLTGLDVLNTTGNYISYFDNNTTISGTGQSLVAMISLNNKYLAGMDTGLVFYSDMETTINTGGTLMLKDLSNYGNNGYFSGTTLPQITNGIVGRALYFTGNSYINVPNSDSINIYNSSITRVAWIRQDVANIQSVVLSKTSNYNLRINYSSGFIRSADTLGNGLSTNYNFNVGQNYFLVGIYDKNTNTIRNYVNGVKIQESVVDGIGRSAVSNTGDFFIQGGGFYGLIDEVRIYNRALSDNEVIALYNAN